MCVYMVSATSVAMFRPLVSFSTFQISERPQRAANDKTSQTSACFGRYLRNVYALLLQWRNPVSPGACADTAAWQQTQDWGLGLPQPLVPGAVLPRWARAASTTLHRQQMHCSQDYLLWQQLFTPSHCLFPGILPCPIICSKFKNFIYAVGGRPWPPQ